MVHLFANRWAPLVIGRNIGFNGDGIITACARCAGTSGQQVGLRVKQICRPDKAFCAAIRHRVRKIPDGSFALSGLRFDCSGFRELNGCKVLMAIVGGHGGTGTVNLRLYGERFARCGTGSRVVPSRWRTMRRLSFGCRRLMPCQRKTACRLGVWSRLLARRAKLLLRYGSLG